MKKEFYIGQPLIVKGTGERATFVYNNGDSEEPCVVLMRMKGKHLYHYFYDYEDLEPSTEFTFPELISGLEQGYFDVGTEFRVPSTNRVITVVQGVGGLYLDRLSLNGRVFLASRDINSTWTLVEDSKEMTLEEIEAELGYKVKLKDSGENLNREKTPYGS